MKSLLTNNLAQRIEQSEINTLSSRLTAIRKIDGNPMGVEIKNFGSATAFSVMNIPGPSFNKVMGIKDEDIDEIQNILDFYKEKNIPVRFDLTPAHVSPEILKVLADKGFYQSNFHTTLYAALASINLQREYEIPIRPLEKNEFDTYADIYTKGFGMPKFLRRGVAENNEVLHDNKQWYFFIAGVDGQYGGIGVLHVVDGVANLAAAATLPSMRNKGIQKALIHERMKIAKEMKCEFVVGQAKYGSISQNNMENLGMRIAYTKAIWVQK